MPIAANIVTLRQRIEKAKQNAPLSAARVQLLGASKGQPAAAIIEAIASGVTDFGENRVQEAGNRWPELKKRHPEIMLHLIGPLQTNKVKEALALFDVVQTIDRQKLAVAITKAGDAGFNIEAKKFFIQVNTGEEPQKAGVKPQEATALIEYCQKLQLPVVGLMCIPPAGQPAAPHFALLRQMAERHGLRELSMGMSEDFETAVRMGSTCVRIGRALFGERGA